MTHAHLLTWHISCLTLKVLLAKVLSPPFKCVYLQGLPESAANFARALENYEMELWRGSINKNSLRHSHRLLFISKTV